jgi:hypothetical protein
VKHLKLALLICGALGIAGILLIGVNVLANADRGYTILMFVAFGLPVAMAALAVVRPPMRAWQAGVALAGFSLAAWKLKIWDAIRLFADEPTGQRLMVIGAGLGVILSILVILKPEEIAQ